MEVGVYRTEVNINIHRDVNVRVIGALKHPFSQGFLLLFIPVGVAFPRVRLGKGPTHRSSEKPTATRFVGGLMEFGF